MADRVHPIADSPDTAAEPEKPTTTPMPMKAKLKPRAGEYVIWIPKEQTYRVPPPETVEKFEAYTRRAGRRPRLPCRSRLLDRLLSCALLLLLLATASASVLYLVFQPQLPSYSLDRLSITGLNASAEDLTLSPAITTTVRTVNPNKKIAIEYGNGSTKVSYSGVELCAGMWPAFYQGPGNETAFQMVLKGSGVQLSRALHWVLQVEQRRGEVPLEVGVDFPLRVKVGAAWSWTMDVKVLCGVKVDKLTAESRIVSKECRVKVDV